MATSCQVCTHESRAAIEQAILNAKPKAKIARDFGYFYMSKGRQVPNTNAIKRHADRCMKGAYERAHANREKKSGEAIVSRLDMLDAEVDKVIAAVHEGTVVMVGDVPLLDDEGRQVKRHDWRLLLSAVAQGRANAELQAKLAGKVEGDPADLDAIRGHLGNPVARRLLAQLEELAAAQADQTIQGN